MPDWIKDKRAVLLTTLAVVWTLCVFDWLGSGLLRTCRLERFGAWIHGCVFVLATLVALYWFVEAWKERTEHGVRAYLTGTVGWFPCWTFYVFYADLLGWDSIRVWIAQAGTAATYVGGLCWVVWGLEQQARHFRNRRLNGREAGEKIPPTLHPLDPEARYYGRQKTLNQSVSAFCSYSTLFIMAFYFMTNIA
ncbi:MAG: hypothetical protein VB858_22005, partial [Planctomycetaceae bacterium]